MLKKKKKEKEKDLFWKTAALISSSFQLSWGTTSSSSGWFFYDLPLRLYTASLHCFLLLCVLNTLYGFLVMDDTRSALSPFPQPRPCFLLLHFAPVVTLKFWFYKSSVLAP